MNELALFAGAGGGILGGHLLGWRTATGEDVFVVENGELIGSIRKYGDTSNQIVIVTDNG